MSKLIIMRGLPASGKSTKAEELVIASGNAVRLNKDLMRKMLHFDKFTLRNEQLTRNAMATLATEFLLDGKTVIIDDTNLNGRTFQGWKDLAARAGASVEVIDMDVQTEECVFRDGKRESSVGGTVIKNMALRYGRKIFSPDSVVLCDIDGTIADITHRLSYVHPPEGQKKDWGGFFSKMHLDTVRNEVREILIKHYNEGRNIIFVSARPDTYKDVTLDWLRDNNLSFAYTLIMRNKTDSRPDTEVKKDILDIYFPDKSMIHRVIDDRPSVIRMWKEQGLDVLDVGDGVEF